MKLEKLQEAMEQEEQVDCKVIHKFSDGVYARTLIIERGVSLVGARHKTNHFLMVSQGEGYFVCNDGEPEYYSAPMLIETKAGTKRAIVASTRTIMTAFHATDETDVDKIGEAILEKEDPKTLPQWKRKALEVYH